ncbi:MAG: CDP-alcohol phosphatidyltransferase family protein [Dactylosporangium sp.]|nr:CDP-alcohol phosphatidyltransferase family protein [Dactylosporangium sp.]NNJ60671.1 CDP-alcohol phosphatidyltransferase family protein [Dactylosporangium sp.]
MDPTEAEERPDFGRVVTLANVISFGRLIGVPIVLYLLLVAHEPAMAVVVLVIGGTSDWVDGYIARRLRQVSRLGTLLDPLADRLYLLATVLAFAVIGVIPWAFTVALLAREALLGACLIVLRRHGQGPPPVHYLGKTATFLLLCAFPMLLLAEVSAVAAPVAGACGWALAWWGIVLYWIAAGLYLWQMRDMTRSRR